jgi:hypothetical protein
MAKISKEQEEIVKRLNAIIKILLETSRPEGKEIPMAQRIQILLEAGFRPVEISEIVGWSPTSVTSVITKFRKSKAKQSKKPKIA